MDTETNRGCALWFLIPEQKTESERQGVPQPGSRGSGRPEKGLPLRTSPAAPGDVAPPILSIGNALKFAGGSGSWVEASLWN